MSADPSIRPASDADLPWLARVYEEAGLDRPGKNDATVLHAAWRRLLRLQELGVAQVLVAESQGQPVGTLTCFILPLLAHNGTPAAVVEDVAVHPSAQGRGVGRALIEAAMRLAAGAGCYKLALSSNRRREQAHAFYHHLGFAPHGVSFVVDLAQDQP